MKSRTKRIAVGVMLFAAPTLQAANFTWDGGALLGPQWSRDNNWVGDTAPPSDGTADLFFTGSDRLDAEADANWSIRSLTFNSGASPFAIQGSTLTTGTGGISNNDNTPQTVFNNIVLASP